MRKLLNIYCAGAPNYFIYGVSEDLDTYCLIDNQYWILASMDISREELSKMTLVDKGRMCNVQD